MDLQKDITQTNKSKVELFIWFLLHFADTTKIFPQLFKVKKTITALEKESIQC